MELENKQICSHTFEVVPTEDHHLDVKIEIIKIDNKLFISLKNLKEVRDKLNKAFSHKRDQDEKMLYILNELLRGNTILQGNI